MTASHFFARYADALVAAGWPFIPILPHDAVLDARGKEPEKVAATEKSRGKAPGRWTGSGWWGLFDWRHAGVPHPFVVESRKRWPACGIGFVCGVPCGDGESHIIGADIDVRHPAAAWAIDQLAVQELGDAPMRIGAAPKRLRMYRMLETIGKLKTANFVMPDDAPGDKPHAVEILGAGQQFVGFGIHPGTARPYEWFEGNPVNLEPQDLTVVTEDQLRAFLAKAEAILLKYGGQPRKTIRQAAHDNQPNSSGDRRARNPDELKQAFATIDNDDVDYDEWIMIGLALKGALGEEGWPLFRDWSARSAKDDPEATGAAWQSFKPDRIGAGTLYHLARQYGWGRPAARQKADPIETVLPPYWPGPTGTKDETMTAMKEAMSGWFATATRNARAHASAQRMTDWLHARIDRWATRQTEALDVVSLGDEAALRQNDIERQQTTLKRQASRKVRDRAERKFGVSLAKDVVGERLQVSAPAGSGKTTMVGELLNTNPGLMRQATTWVMAPDHALVDQTATTLSELGIVVTVIRGRAARHPVDPKRKMCARWETAEELAKEHLNIFEGLCANCPFATACKEEGYLSQHTNKPGVYILAHPYMMLTASPAPKPDLIIVDESHWHQFIRYAELLPDDIVQPFKYNAENIDGLIRWSGIAAHLRDAVVVENGRILAAVREQLTPDDLTFALTLLGKMEEETMPSINGAMSDEAIRQEIRAKADELNRIRALHRLILSLQREAGLDRDHSIAVTLRPDVPSKVTNPDGSTTIMRLRRVGVAYAVHQPSAERVPVLLIDASAHLATNRRIWGERLQDSGVRVERNAHVTQVASRSFSRTQMFGIEGDAASLKEAQRLRDGVVNVVRRVKERHGSVVVISYNELAETIAAGAGADAVLHYGKVRGQNVAEGCGAGVILGREQPLEAAERAARALHAMDMEPIVSIDPALWQKGWFKQTRRYRMREGTVVPAEVSVHPDPRVQVLLEQMREREIEQAIDRLRLIHNVEVKAIYLLTSVPVDITVDRLLSWKELHDDGSRFERAWQASGVLPLGAAFLRKTHPTLWETEKAAEHALQRGQDALLALPGAVEVAFRAVRTAGCASRALVDSRRHPDLRAALEAALGQPVETVGKDGDALPNWIRPAMARAGGTVLPLVPGWLHQNLTDLFPSKRTAERRISAVLKTATTPPFCNKDIYYSLGVLVAVYRTAQQKRPSHALVAPGVSELDARTTLSTLLDQPLDSFALVTQPRSPTAAPLSATPAAAPINLADAGARLAALSARLAVAQPTAVAAAILEDLALRLELSQPATVVTMTDAVPFADLPLPPTPAPEPAAPVLVPHYRLVLAAQSLYRRNQEGGYRKKTAKEHAGDVAALEEAWTLCRGAAPAARGVA